MGTFIILLLAVFPSLIAGLDNNEGRQFDFLVAKPPRPSPRIVGGQKATENQFPYQVAILSMSPPSWCGGSLIAKRWVLTAAYCLDGAAVSYMCIGATHLKSYRNCRQIFSIVKSDFHIHEEFNSVPSRNDIALIKLPNDARLSGAIQIVDLPSMDVAGNSFEGTTAIASGWGATLDKKGSSSMMLRYAELSVVPQTACEKIYGDPLTRTHICTTGLSNQQPCYGDEGGPLVTFVDGKRMIIGVFSAFSCRGCEAGKPAIYTRVTEYLDWIKGKIERN